MSTASVNINIVLIHKVLLECFSEMVFTGSSRPPKVLVCDPGEESINGFDRYVIV